MVNPGSRLRTSLWGLAIVILIGLTAFNLFGGLGRGARSVRRVDISAPANPNALRQTRTNPIDGAVMVWIPAGEFEMGSSLAENERPTHRVTLDGFWMYAYPVTVGQFRTYCDATHSRMPFTLGYGVKSEQPMVFVNWDMAKSYSKWAFGDSASARLYLPTEAQYERAARGPEGFEYPWGAGWDSTKGAFSVGAKRLDGPVPVGAFPPNGFGLCDMSGNVWEWCADWSAANYQNAAAANPTGPADGAKRVLRGGGWSDSDPSFFRTAHRDGCAPVRSNPDVGFRCASGASQ